MRFLTTTICLFFLTTQALAAGVLNIYVWSGEIPDAVIQQFENETGINVNYATYDANETMYAKLKASASGYDIIEPSSYFVDRMRRQGMLAKLDKTQLSNYKNLDPEFINPDYDPTGEYSIPYLWGVTGIYVNKKYYDPKSVTSWSDLWDSRFKDQIMLLDDPREVFSMGLISLGYSPNDTDPNHIQQAYQKLLLLRPNIKLFNNDAMPSIPIDEDATVGMGWNGDVYRATVENPNVQFIFPQDGYVIWVDNFAIPKNAVHLKEAYEFLNFMLRPDIASQATLAFGYGITNRAGQVLLPKNLRDNPVIFPDKKILAKGHFQVDVGDAAEQVYEKYWELLKLGG